MENNKGNTARTASPLAMETPPRRMEARVSSFVGGLEVYGNVQLIRIKSKTYTLLIMADYLPTLGEIDGSVTLVTDKGEMAWDSIRGYYVHKTNVFSLMIEEEYHD